MSNLWKCLQMPQVFKSPYWFLELYQMFPLLECYSLWMLSLSFGVIRDFSPVLHEDLRNCIFKKKVYLLWLSQAWKWVQNIRDSDYWRQEILFYENEAFIANSLYLEISVVSRLWALIYGWRIQCRINVWTEYWEYC